MLHRLFREQGRFWFEDEDSNLINNRQNGRRRGRGGQRSQGSSQGQRDNGNRIDSRARGNASQLHEKYKNMAADAQRQGDRVNTEYYLQFADHYFRVLADQRGRYEDQGRDRRPQNDFDADDDFGDEGEPIRADEQNRGGDERGDRDGRQDGRQHDGNRARPERDENQDRRSRYTRDTRGDARREEQVNSNVDVSHPAEIKDTAAPAQMTSPADASSAGDEAPAPKRRGRPRKAPVDGGEQLGLDAAALPPSIGSEGPTADTAPKPRRRRSAAVPAEAEA